MTHLEHLQALCAKHGYLTPELVVEAARPEDSPLHGWVFDRSVGDAAEAWYRERARELIGEYKITFKRRKDGIPLRLRAFTAVRQEEGYVFLPTQSVVTDPLLREVRVEELKREMQAVRDRWHVFEEFWQIVAAWSDEQQAA